MASVGRIRRVRLHPWLVHLRLGFNLLLAPIFLWGTFLAGGRVDDPGFWLGFIAVHLFLYGGTTAYNSYWDRDEGPIGGLLAPPPVDEGLLRFSLVVQGIGVLPAALVGIPFLVAWLLLFLVFTAYSHPLVRLKANPASALAAIAVGQGALGFALGWLAVAGPGGLVGGPALVGIAAAAAVVSGLYIVTQSYQVPEDRDRGDRTLPVLLGARRALLLALVPLAVGGGLLAWLVSRTLDGRWVPVLLGFFLVLGAWLAGWAARFEEGRVTTNFRVAMRFVAVASSGLTLFLLANLLR